VVKKYSNYYVPKEIANNALNRGYVTISTFENNRSLYQYNSFIFGNSRAAFLEIADWKPYLDTTSVCFHFDAWGEPLYGIYKKVKYLNQNKTTISNALLLLDYLTLEQTASSKDHLTMISPQLEDGKNIIQFHLTFIRVFFNLQFMTSWLDYKLSKPQKETEVTLPDSLKRHYDLKTNELTYPYLEKLIQEGAYYTPERMKVFYPRDTTQQSYYPIVILEKQKQMLNEINDIFQKNKTDFKVIINPLYDQKKLAEEDLAYLEATFGKHRVFDFSGINRITNDYSNYYEDAHYRPHVAKEILKTIYTTKHND
jgi:hypothetical protein